MNGDRRGYNMKRCFALILTLALTLSLLTSCELLSPAPTERPSIGLPGESAPTETADPTADEYGFTLFPEGNYLADPKFDTDDFLPDYDADISFVQHGSTETYALCRTADTVYSFSYAPAPQRGVPVLMYTDRATGITLPLCGRPECTHDNESCNAYVGLQASGLCLYDGKLYWLSDGLTLTRMNPDGTGRETVTMVDRQIVKMGMGGDATYVLHRGYVYIGGMKETVIGSERKSSFTVYAKSLDSGEDFTILSRVQDGGAAYCSIRPVGNDLYIMLTYRDYEDWENREGAVSSVELYRWDSRTRKAECLYSANGDQWGITNMCFPLPVPGDGIYLGSCHEGEAGEGPGYIMEYQILKYSFATGSVEEAASFSLANGGTPRFTKEHIITFAPASGSEKCVYAFDYSGNLVFQSEPLTGHSYISLMGEDGQYIYFHCMGGMLAGETDGEAHMIAVPIDLNLLP